MSKPAEAHAGKSFLPSLQVFRGVAALLVILTHATDIYDNLLHRHFLGGIWGFGWAGVNFFFVLSGFVIFFIHGKDIGRPERALPYVKKRLTRIYPAYWVVLAIRCLLATGSYATKDQTGLLDILKAVALWPVEGALVSVSWTLSHEIFFYLIFFLCILSSRKVALTIAGIAFVSSMSGFVWPGFDAQIYLVRFLFSYHNIEFLLGCLAAWLVLNRRGVPYGRAVMWVGISLFAASGVLWVRGHHFAPLVLFGIPSTLVVLGAASSDTRAPGTWPRPLVFLGDASYSIYLVHATAIYNFVRLGSKTMLKPVLENVVGMILLVPIIAGAGIAFYLIVERPLLALFRGKSAKPKPVNVEKVVPEATV